MPMPRDWFKYEQDVLDMAMYEYDVLLGVQRPEDPDEALPEQIGLLVPSGELMWNEAFKLSKKLFCLREAVRNALTGERKSAVQLPPGLASFVRKVVLLRPGRPAKGLGAVTPAFLIIAGSESPYRAATLRGLELFRQSPEYRAVQEMKRARALRELGETAVPVQPQETPEERWEREKGEQQRLWEKLGASQQKGGEGEKP